MCSGLALAGANRLESGTDDGILTALEIAGLDLRGTKLVVLSACETGLGEISVGEGVYGLRRSLVIAGAESQLASLWKVDDTATQELMEAYYRRLGAGEGRANALRHTQLEMLHSTRWKHPYYWASFIPIGAWGPVIGVDMNYNRIPDVLLFGSKDGVPDLYHHDIDEDGVIDEVGIDVNGDRRPDRAFQC